MSINICWTPITRGEKSDLDTWRPSWFLSRLKERLGDQTFYLLGIFDAEWLMELADEMGVDGGGNCEASQLIAAIAKHGSVMVEIDP